MHEGSGRFLQVAGLRYVYDPAQPVGHRIVSVQIADAAGHLVPLDPKAEYRLVSNHFMARGGDGFTVLVDRARDVEGDSLLVYDLVAQWITAHSPLKPALDGRIVAK